jgi:hypothetical protein
VSSHIAIRLWTKQPATEPDGENDLAPAGWYRSVRYSPPKGTTVNIALEHVSVEQIRDLATVCVVNGDRPPTDLMPWVKVMNDEIIQNITATAEAYDQATAKNLASIVELQKLADVPSTPVKERRTA